MVKEINGASDNHRWLASQNLSLYLGKWIAVANQTIIASGITLKEVIEASKKMGVDPLFLRVPEGYITT